MIRSDGHQTTESESVEQPADGLQLAIVHYADQPDRCTVSPPPARECDRMTTWLSANREVLEDLMAMR